MSSTLVDWVLIGIIVCTATAGDVLVTKALRKLGDLDIIRAQRGLGGAIAAVISSPYLLLGVGCMAISFFSLLAALSRADLSLIGPASASLTFVTNAVAAKFFLRENVDRRRWAAAGFVCAGVALLVR
jgi:drug/metabolite transporter (DMT)-like permease